jgi:DNA helicase-2/ATP-dependent DNA helicase PcrA
MPCPREEIKHGTRHFRERTEAPAVAWNDGLSGPSLEFASSDERLLRSLAGPGTGKTFALIRRIARLLEEGIEPDRILVLTFARTAAQDLVRALEELGEEGYADVRARTLHSYCFSLLGRAAVLTATGRVPRILMDFEKDAALWDLDGPFGGIRQRRELAKAFEAAWARRQTDAPGDPIDGLDQRFQDALRGWLRWHKGMLVGELVPEALAYLRHNPHSPELTAYDHVLVDEYQDLNRAEQELIDLFSGERNLAVIGDDDQSIYSFKWANPEGIRQFPADHVGTHDVNLEECRRCPTGVVTLARALLDRDTSRPGDHRLEFFPENPAGEIHNVQWHSIQAEAGGLAAFVQGQTSNGTPEGECLILTPRRSLGYAIRDALADLGIEADTFFREQPVESEAAQRALTVLTLLVAPADRVAQRAWLGFGSGDWHRATYRRVAEAARQEADRDVFATLAAIRDGTLAVPYSAALVSRWQEYEVIKLELLPLLDDLPALVDRLTPDGDSDLELLRTVALAAVEEADRDPAQFLNLLRVGIAQPEVPIHATRARIMSFHRSKGLNAQVVVLAGLVEGLMPQAPDPDEPPEVQEALRKEQRRLFYVGVTRTRRVLVLSSEYELPAALVQQNSLPHGAWTGSGYRTHASSFLRELGPTLPDAIRGRDWTY